jgi:hypothetical protein
MSELFQWLSAWICYEKSPTLRRMALRQEYCRVFSPQSGLEMELPTANETAIRFERKLDSLSHLCRHLLVAPWLTQRAPEHSERLAASSIAAEVERVEDVADRDGQPDSRSENRHRALPVTRLGKPEVESQIHTPPAHDDDVALVLEDAERHEFERTPCRLNCGVCHVSLL